MSLMTLHCCIFEKHCESNNIYLVISFSLLLLLLSTRSRSIGEESSQCANVLFSIGHALRRAGRIDEAQRAFEQSKQISERIHGAQHITVGDCSMALASLYRLQDRWNEAIQSYEQSLVIFKNSNEPTSAAIAVDSLALALYAQDRLDEAFLKFKESIEINTQLSGGNDSIESIARTLRFMARILKQKSDFDSASQCFEQSVSIYKKLSKQVLVADTLMELGELIQQQKKKNDSNDAKQYFKQALEIYSTTSLQAETVRNKILECSK